MRVITAIVTANPSPGMRKPEPPVDRAEDVDADVDGDRQGRDEHEPAEEVRDEPAHGGNLHAPGAERGRAARCGGVAMRVRCAMAAVSAAAAVACAQRRTASVVVRRRWRLGPTPGARAL